MKKENKDQDIVERIIQELKEQSDLPYEAGAWERFRDTRLQPTAAKPTKVWWIGAAAAACLMCVAVFWWQNNPSTEPSKDLSVASNNEQSVENADSTTSIESYDGLQPNVSDHVEPNDAFPMQTFAQRQQQSDNTRDLLSGLDSRFSYLSGISGQLQTNNELFAGNMQFPKVNLSIVENDPSDNSSILMSNQQLPSVFSTQDDVALTQRKEVVGESKRFRLRDKFDLGVVVAPSATDQKMNFGGGLMVAYNVTKQLSVRTGATFHQYEVGALRDPMQAASMEVAAAPERPIQADMPTFSNALAMRMPLIPHVNSVSGMVRTIDIPIEAKYSFYKGVYAGVGVSYAAVLDQQRFAHYIENVNANPYANGLPSDEREMRDAVQPVVQTLESANSNVDANGFGGFVNMSLGKEVKIRRGPSLSIEPYLKLPVGNFKRADMNYTNGGVRIITNF